MGTPGAVISACFADLEKEQRSPVPRAKRCLYNREENKICLNASASLPNRLPEWLGWKNFSWASVYKSIRTKTKFILPFAFRKVAQNKAKPEHRSSPCTAPGPGITGLGEAEEGELLEKVEGEETWSFKYFQGKKNRKEQRSSKILRFPCARAHPGG